MAARYTDDKGPHYTTWANNYSYFPVTRFVDTDPQGNPIGIEKAPDTKVLPRLLASPDPFNASTILHYSLPGAGVVSVDIFNVEGKLVASLLKSRQPAGSGALKFDARQLPGGVYIAQMRLGNRKLTRRITLLK
jgi:hypothetical protein